LSIWSLRVAVLVVLDWRVVVALEDLEPLLDLQ
jgi:hypothetical protein